MKKFSLLVIPLLLILFSFSFVQTAQATGLFYSTISTTTLYFWPLTSNFTATVGTSTSSFSRNFDAAEQQSSGLWLDKGHQTPRFSNGAYTNETAVNNNNNFFPYPNSETRDLTLTAWVKVNMTALKNQPGVTTQTATGTADLNVASAITATANNATILATTTVLASSVRTFSAYVKRLTGSGSVFITQDGTNWSDVTSLINNSTYVRVSTTTASAVTSPIIGFKLGTSGDSIAVDMAQNENSDAPTSPFWLRGDRQSDSLTLNGLSGFATSSRYRMTADVTLLNNSANGGSFTLGPVIPNYNPVSSSIGKYGGSLLGVNASNPIYTSIIPTSTVNVLNNFGVEWGPANIRIIMNGARWGSDINANPSVDRSAISSLVIGGNQQVKNLKIEQVTNYNNVVWFGDSITASNPGFVTYAQPFMPGLEFFFTNKGVGGDGIQDLINRQSSDLNPLYVPVGASNVVVIFIGTNSLAAGVSTSTAIAQLQALINNIHAAGNWKVVTITTLARDGGFSNGVTKASFLAAAQDYNSAQRNGTITGISRVIDAASLSSLQNSDDPVLFDSFHIHPQGQALVDLGTYVANALLADISITASPSSIFQNSTGNTITLTGSSTSWTTGTGTSSVPVFTLSGGTGASITSQIVTSSTTATLIISAGSQTGTLVITDPSSSASTSITVLPNSRPTLATQTASSVNTTSATLNATLTDDGHASSTIRGFNYGLTTSYGSVASSTGTFDIGTFNQSITGLSCGTTYHVQAFATNVAGTGTSTDTTFTTSTCPSTTPVTTTTSSGGTVSSAFLATLLAPGPATTAYLESLNKNKSPVNSSTFTQNLTVGSQSSSVKTLQQYLNAAGFTVATTGPGSPGHETTTFGGLTKKALAKFQKANSLPATGFFGPLTRAKLKALGY
ncbi:MAG: peptidoglycan-binding protein [Candidatus Pacebacteria bacterium]|nr:peptidoglycan-binding protein [Candidatus Paceibacterota bacterium]